MNQNSELPVVVIGAGPIGLAAAANLAERGQSTLVFESGSEIAASIHTWGHVRLFTPWSFLVDPSAVRLLEASGNWRAPDPNTVPLGSELVEGYLEPLASLPQISAMIRLDHRVTAITREGHDRMKDGTRDESPFQVWVDTPDGPKLHRARAVIDASGTWTNPNPIGSTGIPAIGESEHSASIHYGIPDVLQGDRTRYQGKRTLVVGSGHSAIGTLLNLAQLAKESDNTKIYWAVRRTDPRKLWGGGDADELPQRGALGKNVYEAVQSSAVHLITGFSIGALRSNDDAIEVFDIDDQSRAIVDEIVVATGSRPDHSFLRELRLEFDLVTESTKHLGPMIDPNHHSCGSVKPHGAKELQHPERDFYIVGMKSYGRAPTFLLRTGYEQVRSVVAEIAGDHDAARRIELKLPKTGVCSTDFAVAAEAKSKPKGCCA